MKLEERIRSRFEHLFDLKKLIANARLFQEWYQLTSFENQKNTERLFEAYPSSSTCEEKIKALKAGLQRLELELSNLKTQPFEYLSSKLDDLTGRIAYLRNQQAEKITALQKKILATKAATVLDYLKADLNTVDDRIRKTRAILSSYKLEMEKVRKNILHIPAYYARFNLLQHEYSNLQKKQDELYKKLDGYASLKKEINLEIEREEQVCTVLEKLTQEKEMLEKTLGSADSLAAKLLAPDCALIESQIRNLKVQKLRYEILLVIAGGFESKAFKMCDTFEKFCHLLNGCLEAQIKTWNEEAGIIEEALDIAFVSIEPLALAKITQSFRLYLQEGGRVYGDRMDDNLRLSQKSELFIEAGAYQSKKAGMSPQVKRRIYEDASARGKFEGRRKFIPTMARLMHYADSEIDNRNLAPRKPSSLFIKGVQPQLFDTHLLATAEKPQSPKSPEQHGVKITLSPKMREAEDRLLIMGGKGDGVFSEKLQALTVKPVSQAPLDPRADTPVPWQKGCSAQIEAVEERKALAQALSEPPTRPAPKPPLPLNYAPIAAVQYQSSAALRDKAVKSAARSGIKIIKPVAVSGKSLPPPPVAPDLQTARKSPALVTATSSALPAASTEVTALPADGVVKMVNPLFKRRSVGGGAQTSSVNAMSLSQALVVCRNPVFGRLSPKRLVSVPPLGSSLKDQAGSLQRSSLNL
jgi:hypothetical protein